MSIPVAVLISDIHYNLNTLELADASLRMAMHRAHQLKVPLIVAGDLHDTKALMRGEAVNAMLKTFGHIGLESYVLVGNHDRLNEKAPEHSLEFLRKSTNLIQGATHVSSLGLYLLPYFSDLGKLKETLDGIPKGSTIIMHQGVTSAHGGHYMNDPTAAPAEWFSDFRVISGHYHRRQDIKCGRPRAGGVGLFSYIGSPYSTSWSEANDPEKGFQVLMSDGTLEFVPTNLRRHRVLEFTVGEALDYHVGAFPKEDLLWVKIRGTRSELANVDKAYLGRVLGIGQSFKLDLIPIEETRDLPLEEETLTDLEVLDKLIDGLPDSQEYRDYLKGLTQEVLA